MEFTPEQQAHIDKLIAEATKGLYTEEELSRRVTAEVDRRVESGIQKGIETQKAKWEKEFIQKTQMSAEELAKKELEEKMKDITAREQEIQKRANTLDAKDMLSSADIPKSHYEKFIDFLVSEDTESTTQNVQNFIDAFNETRSQIESNIKEQYINVPPPKGGNGDNVVTKEDFDNMSYIDKMKFKETNPDTYSEFIKQ